MMIYDFLSIIVPAYNEEGNIAELIKRVSGAVSGSEIIVIDDGSIDQTSVAAKNTNYPRLKVLKNNHNTGKGKAVKQGILAGSGKVMVQIDADLQFLPEEIPKLIRPILENEVDIVFGSRYLKGDKIENGSVSPIKRLASYVTSILVSLICLKHYADVFAGMKAWKSGVLQGLDLRIDNFGYEAEIAIMAKKRGYRVREVPISYKKRLFGKSKIKIIKDAFVISKAVFETFLFRT